jgi:hypothetical protein
LNENVNIEQIWINKKTNFFNENQFKTKNGDIIEIDYYIHNDIFHITGNWIYDNKKIPIGVNQMKKDDNGYLRTIGMLKVNSGFRRQGVATAIYDYLDNEGYKIKPTNKTGNIGFFDDGIDFWKSNIKK